MRAILGSMDCALFGNIEAKLGSLTLLVVDARREGCRCCGNQCVRYDLDCEGSGYIGDFRSNSSWLRSRAGPESVMQ